MRILEIVHGFPPAAIGGTELYAQSHARALQRGGDEVLVFTREHDVNRAEYEVRTETRGAVRVISVNNTFRKTRTFEETYRNTNIDAIAANLIDTFKPEAAHIHHLTGLSTSIVRLLAERRVPTVFTLHDFWLMCHRGQLLDVNYRLCDGPGTVGCHACLPLAAGAGSVAFAGARVLRTVERRLPAAWVRRLREVGERSAALLAGSRVTQDHERLRIAHMRSICDEVTHFLAPSRYIRDQFVKFGVRTDRITVSTNGVQPIQLAPDLHVGPKPLRLGFLGGLMVSKGLHILLEAVARLPTGSVTVDVFGGSSTYHGDDSYRRRVEPLLIGVGARVHGPFAHEQVGDKLSSIDVLVAPSIWPENAPLVIQEAFLARIPVVASRIGGIPEMVIHDVNGLLFNPGDAEDLSRSLRRLIDEPRLVATLRAAMPAVRTIEEDVRKTRDIYSATAARPVVSRRKGRLAAVVLNYRTPDETLLAVKSLIASRRPLEDIIVVNNDSRDDTHDALHSVWPKITYIHTGANLGFSGGTNVGVRHALATEAHRILLVNSDVIVPPDAVERLEACLDQAPRAGIAGPIVLARSAPDQIASLGMSYAPSTGRMRHGGYGTLFAGLSRPVDHVVDGVSGCLMLVTRDVFETVGLFDEDFFFSFEDLDFCLRARRAGFATMLAGRATVYHEGGQSLGASSPRRFYFAARNHLLLAKRAEPSVHPLRAWSRTSSIVALNLAHAISSRGGSMRARFGAAATGALDYFRGRFGAAS
jgi:GT2 family glycosyltransferase/glycosyltransferase involved in cell wall biosynthesis